MKKLILSLTFLIVAIGFVSGQELRPKVAIDYFANSEGSSYTINNKPVDLGHYRARIGVDFVGNISKTNSTFKDVKYFASANNQTYMNNSGGPKFNPRLMIFDIGGGLSYKNIKISYTHTCVHPTKSFAKTPLEVYSSTDMISISYGY